MSRKKDALKQRMEKPEYTTVFDQANKKFEVIHNDNGTLLDNISDFIAATAIAQLACLGYLNRGDDGALYLDCDHDNVDVESMEEFMESFSEESNDDSPEDKDEDASLCPPTDELEYRHEEG